MLPVRTQVPPLLFVTARPPLAPPLLIEPLTVFAPVLVPLRSSVIPAEVVPPETAPPIFKTTVVELAELRN